MATRREKALASFIFVCICITLSKCQTFGGFFASGEDNPEYWKGITVA